MFVIGKGSTKEHPVVIVDTDEACASGDSLQVVVISTKIQTPCPHFHLKVHSSFKTDPRTGLYEPCVVKCNWRQVVDQRRLLGPQLGSMLDTTLDMIIEKINELIDDESFTDWVDGDSA